MEIEMEKVAWDEALKELNSSFNKDKQWKWKRFEAEISSLSALFISEFSKAAQQINRAVKIEPFNPLHRYRQALLYMRFAQWDEALSMLDDMKNQLPEFSYLFDYLRALIYLRKKKYKRAANIINQIINNKPDLTQTYFLNVEVQIRQKWKGAESRFYELPKDNKHLGLWLDLLVKMIVAHPGKGAKSVEGFLKRAKILSKDSVEGKLIRQIIQWSTASTETLKNLLVKIPADSKAEQVVLLFYHDRLKRRCKKYVYLMEMKRLYQSLPHRTAIRRMYIAVLNRYAVEEAAAKKYRSALAVVEICLRLEPFNLIHYQNRATLFTLLREKKAYHRSWEELDILQYRLALLGRIGPKRIQILAKRHRMFVQQARLSRKLPDTKFIVNTGIFREEQTNQKGSEEMKLVVNQQQIDTDQEQLRQWIHHRKAELFLLHFELGADPDHFLLGFRDDVTSIVKIEGLALLGQSLTVLAGEAGRLAARNIKDFWQKSVEKNSCNYLEVEETPEIRYLKKSHLETLGDLAMLCFCWQPNARDSEIVDELIEFMGAEILFLDIQMLSNSRENWEEKESYSVSYLRQAALKVLDPDESAKELSHQQRKKIGKHLTDYLLLHLSKNVFEESKHAPKDAAGRCIKILERSRGEIPDNPEIEYYAARYFYIADYYDETRKGISRFYRANQDDESPLIASVEELQSALDKVEKDDRKDYFAPGGHFGQSNNRSMEEQLIHFKEDLEQHPSSIYVYENLTHCLVSEGRFEEALEWSERAIGRCLSRKGQLKARMLNIELLGLQKLGLTYIDEVKLYLSGIPVPLKEVIEEIHEREPAGYELLYLLGICLLKEGEPDHARQFFGEALANCNKQIHFAILRPLSLDVEQTLYTMAKESIEEFIAGQHYSQAFEYIVKRMQKMKVPGLMLIDLATVQLAALINHLKSGEKVPGIPQMNLTAPWAADLEAALQESEDIEKTRRLTLLAMKVHSDSKIRGAEILRQVDGLKSQLDIAAVLSLSGKHLQEGNFQEALHALDSLMDEGKQEPRILRQRAMLLLKLEKFEEADQVVSTLEAFEDPMAKIFVNRYPSLKFHQKISKVQNLLKKGNTSEALDILDTMQITSGDEELEIVYCYAFALAVRGYQAKSEKEHNTALQLFNEALDHLEPQIESARQKSHNILLELYEKLSKDLDHLKED